MRGAVLVSVLVGLGCRTPAPVPPVPSQGGPAWTELTSAHFVMWTDAAPARGRALLGKLERFHQIVHGVAFPTAGAADRSFVIVFRNEHERAAFVPAPFVAFAWAGGTIFQPVLVFDIDADADDARVVTHELTHVISFALLPDQPRWFAEGLAGFFETVDLDATTAKVAVGRPRADVVARVARGQTLPIARLFACATLACMDDRYYATAAMLFTYLVNQHPQALLRYLERLATVPAEAHPGLWAEVFPTLASLAFDHELRVWIARGRARVWTFDVALAAPTIHERPIGDAEVLAARALLRTLFAPGGPGAPEAPEPPEVAAALAREPTNLLAHLLRAARARTIDVATARRLVAAHPDDWRAWWWLAFALQRTGDAAALAPVRRTLCARARGSHLLPAGWCPAP